MLPIILSANISFCVLSVTAWIGVRSSLKIGVSLFLTSLEPVHDLWMGVCEVIQMDICRWAAMAIAMEYGTEKAVSE